VWVLFHWANASLKFVAFWVIYSSVSVEFTDQLRPTETWSEIFWPTLGRLRRL
jgi:hypothetical protein